MARAQIKSTKWPAWIWIVIAFVAGMIVLALATQLGGAPVPDDSEPTVVYITSPRDGAYFFGRYFGDEPFVEVGSQVQPETIVGTIEGMRQFSVSAAMSGTIVERMVSDGEMVYMGQPLFGVQLKAEPKTP